MISDETKNELLNWIEVNIYGLNYCKEKVINIIDFRSI